MHAEYIRKTHHQSCVFKDPEDVVLVLVLINICKLLDWKC